MKKIYIISGILISIFAIFAGGKFLFQFMLGVYQSNLPITFHVRSFPVLFIWVAASFIIFISGRYIYKLGIHIEDYPKINFVPLFFIIIAFLVLLYGYFIVMPDADGHGLAGLRFFFIQLPASIFLSCIGWIIILSQKKEN